MSGCPSLYQVIWGAGLPLAEHSSTVFPCCLASNSLGGASAIIRKPSSALEEEESWLDTEPKPDRLIT